MYRHEGCGGALKKFGKKGQYRCELCRKMVLRVGTRGYADGYIQRQRDRRAPGGRS